MISISIPADLRALRVVGFWIKGCLSYAGDNQESVIYQIELALQEICVNIVEHAYGSASGQARIQLEYSYENSTHKFIVADQGKPFNPADKPVVDTNDPTEGGYGLFIAESIFDSVEYHRTDTTNTWTLNMSHSMNAGA